MNVKLELQFDSMQELKTYIEKTVDAAEPVAPAVQPAPEPVPTPAVMQPEQPTLSAALQETMPEPVTPAPAAVVEPAPEIAPEPAAAVATTQASYSMDDLARAGTSLVDQGKQDDLIALLEKHGVKSLPELPPASYGAFATDLRALGARI